MFAFMTLFAYGQNLSELRHPQLVIDSDEESVFTASSEPPLMYTSKATSVFFENFDGTTGQSFPPGWTTIATPGGNNWSTTPIPALLFGHSGLRYARILYHSVVAHNAWLFTPGITLTQGTTYRISFYLNMRDHQGVTERLEVKIGNSATVAAMNTLLFDNNGKNYPVWTYVYADYTPSATGQFFIGFHAYSPADVNYIAFDDFSIIEVPQNNLQNITSYQYSQVPETQTLPSGRVKNMGLDNQTNIVLTAELNGSNVGASAPLASLAPQAIANLNLSTSANIPLGDNTMIYTISQTETNDNPADAVRSFTFKGTRNVFAVDEVTTQTQGIGAVSSITIGNVFDITETTTLSQIVVGFGNATELQYTISLYTMTDDLTTALVPVFTIPATRNATGLSFINAPANTVLAPGTYYLCVNQFGTQNISVLYDGNWQAKTSYTRDALGNLASMGPAGAIAIRMVMAVSNCAVDPPSNLSVVPNYTSAVFSWDGEAVRFLLTINDGTQDYTYQTTDNSLTVTGLSLGTSYTWKVVAMCDATQSVETTGTPFTTLDCTPITTFPWEEGFENATFPPTCWFINRVVGTQNWERGWGAYVRTGTGSAAFWAYSGARDVYLISPPITVPAIDNYLLEFWSRMSPNGYNDTTMYSEVLISTTNMNPTSFTPVKRLSRQAGEVTNAFQKISVSLNDFSGQTVLIAFRYVTPAGSGNHGWYIDDISIRNYDNMDVEVVSIIEPISGINLTNNESVTVQLKNNGSTTITGFDLKLEVNGDSITTETYTASIPSTGTAHYTFTRKLDLSATGTYQIKVTAFLAADNDPSNDSQTITVTNRACSAIATFPWVEGFENNGTNIPNCWWQERISGTTDWVILPAGTTGPNPLPNTVHSGNFKAVFYSMVVSRPSGRLITPPMDISNLENPALKFFRTTQAWPPSYDILEVYYKTSINGEWVHLATYNDNVDYWKEEIIALPNPTDDYWISFVATSHWARGVQLDDIQVLDLAGYTDGELVSIDTPNSGELTSQETVKVTVRNNGGTLTNFSLKLELNGVEEATETWTGSMISGEQIQYTFDATLDLSLLGLYEIKVTLIVMGDENPDNNVLTQTVNSFPSEVVELFGYRVWDLVARPMQAFISFASNQPQNGSLVYPYYTPAAPANTMNAGEYVNGYFYGYTMAENHETGNTLRDFVKINTLTATDEFAIPISEIPNDMAYDYTTNVMYGIFTPQGNSNLVTIDLETGAMTTIGSLNRLVIGLACNHDGELFIIDINGNLLAVNKQTAAVSFLGSTGILPNYVQSMAFDHNTGRLFWAMTNETQGRLIEVNPKSGASFNRGTITGEAQVIGLFTKPKQLDVAFVFPANDAVDVATNTEVYVVFNTLNVIANDLSGITVNGNTTTATLSTNKLTINYSGFDIETLYTVHIPAHAIAGYDEAITWSFTTGNPTTIVITENHNVLAVYPNPTTDILHIQTEQAIKQISVLDLNGKIMMQLYGNHKTIDLRSIPTGTYIIRVHTETAIIPVKIIKQ